MSLSDLFTVKPDICLSWYTFFFCFVLKTQDLVLYNLFTCYFFLFLLFLTLEMPASLSPSYSYSKRLVDVFIDICLQISCVPIRVNVLCV